jgi:hypothetical protein
MNKKLESIQKQLQADGAVTEKMNEAIAILKQQTMGDAKKAASLHMFAQVSKVTTKVREMMQQQNDGMKSLIRYLEQKEREAEEREFDTKEIYVQVVTGLKNIAYQLDRTQKVRVTNHYRRQTVTKSEMTEVMTASIDMIEKVLAGKDEIEDAGQIYFTHDHKPSVIERKFSNYTIKTQFTYDNMTNSVKWVNTKSNQ